MKGCESELEPAPELVLGLVLGLELELELEPWLQQQLFFDPHISGRSFVRSHQHKVHDHSSTGLDDRTLAFETLPCWTDGSDQDQDQGLELYLDVDSGLELEEIFRVLESILLQ